jgi:hypothetical protein
LREKCRDLREGEVAGSNPTDHVALGFCAKNTVTCDFDGDGRALTDPGKSFFFAIFLGFFSFQTLPSTRQKTLGKAVFFISNFA